MILVEIQVPALNDVYDFRLDENTRTDIVLGEICEILCRKSKSEIPENVLDYSLIALEDHRFLSMNLTLLQNGVVSGSRLILI